MGEIKKLTKITPLLNQKRLRRQKHWTMYSELSMEEQSTIPAAYVKAPHGQ